MTFPHSLCSGRTGSACGWRVPAKMRVLMPVAAAAVLAVTGASGQTVRTWAGGSGDFSDVTKWSGGVVPGAPDDALFNSAGAFAVSVTNNVETLRLQFDKAGLNADLNIAAGKTYTVGTNFIVKGGSAAAPTRLTLGSGTIQLASAPQSGAPGIGSSFTELVITNASLLGPAAGYFMVAATANSSALVVGPGGYYYGPQILTADQAQYGSNRIEVAGQDARLVCNGNAQIRSGLRGWGNSTVVTNGGYLSCGSFYNGANFESRSNSLVVASGGILELPASSISGTFAVGGNGYRNRGVVETGGLLLIGSSSAYLCVGGNSSAARDSFGYGNELVVRDGGIVTNKGTTCLGGSPTNSVNALVVTNGGYFYAGQHLYVGELGRSNSLDVADNSRLDVGKDLFVGNGNSRTNAWFNRLTVGAGGTVAVGWTAYVGGSGCSNELTVAAGGSLSATNAMTVGVYASATGNVFRLAGGTAYTPGAFTVGDFGSFNRAVIDGGQLTCGAFYVGKSAGSVGNELVLEGGTLLAAAIPFVGYNGSDHSMTVCDAGCFSTTQRFVVGQGGSVNARLNILTGGLVQVKGFLVGDGTVPTNAAASVCGANARLEINGTESGDDIRVGAGAANGSRLTVCDGGIVDAGLKALGVNYSSTATNGQMVVRDGAVYVTNDQFFVQLNGVLRIAGSNSLIQCRNFVLKNSAAVEFEIPALGLQTNAAVIQVSNNLTLSGTPSLAVACSEWVQRTGGKITLLDYTSTLTGDLTALVAAAALDDPRATLAVVGKRVVLSAPSRKGTLLKIF